MGGARYVIITCLVLVAGCSARNVGISPAYDWSVDDVCLRMQRELGWRSGAEIEAAWLSDDRRAGLHDVARRALPSIVEVRTARRVATPVFPGTTGETVATARIFGGTGVVIDRRGIVLTNEHVVRDAESVEIILGDGTRLRVDGMLLAPRRDLAVLRVHAERLTPIGLGNERGTCGAGVVAVGMLGGDRNNEVLVGVITQPMISLQSQLDPAGYRSYEHLVESTARLEPGFSGGPLLNTAGRLVGINVAASGADRRGDVRGYTVPLDRNTRDIVDHLVRALLAETPDSPE